MNRESNDLSSKSTCQISPIRYPVKFKKESDCRKSNETIDLDPYLLSIKLKKAIPSIDKNISDLNETICNLIYSNKTIQKETNADRRSRSRKVCRRPPISSKDKSSTDDDIRDESTFEITLKSPSVKKMGTRLSREAKFQLEKKRAKFVDFSPSRYDEKVPSKYSKYRAQSIGFLDSYLNDYYYPKKRGTSYRGEALAMSRSRAPSNLRASSKVNFNGSLNRIHVENNDNLIPDFPIPFSDQSSEFIVLPPKHIYEKKQIEKINYESSKKKNNYVHNQNHHHLLHQQSNQHQTQQNFGQQIQHQYYPNHQQVIHQQQVQLDLNPQDLQQMIQISPAQQSEMLNQIQQQVYAAQTQQMHQNELITQLQHQNMPSLTPAQELEMTFKKLQNLYINQPVMNNNIDMLTPQQQQDMAFQQYLALQTQGQPTEMINSNQQQLSQQELQIQNMFNLQNQPLANQYLNSINHDMQLGTGKIQNGQSQFQYMNYTPESQAAAQKILKSSKMAVNFLGMVFEPNQHQF